MKQLKVAFVMFGFFCIFLFCIVMLNGCGGGGSSTSSSGTGSSSVPTPAKNLSPTKEITTFRLDAGSGIGTPGVITDSNIVVTVPFAKPRSNLVASFTTTGVTVLANGVIQTSGQMVNDFSAPTSYTVTAADGTSKTYTVKVLNASISAKDITAFSLRTANSTAVYPGIIMGTSISVVIPSGTDPSSLIATYTTSGQDVMINGVFQDNGITSNDFTNPVVLYTTIDANGMTKTYTVTITTASTSAKEISKFSLNGSLSDPITSNNINVVLPFGTDLTSLSANYIITGANLSIKGITQINSLMSNDFSKGPVTYTVTAMDGTTATYTVNATTASNIAKEITYFSLNGVNGTITGSNITVALPTGTDLTSIAAEFVTTGTNVSANGVTQTSAYTTNDFSQGPVTYAVTDSGGNVANYFVTATNQ